jgi:hypothetical protein
MRIHGDLQENNIDFRSSNRRNFRQTAHHERFSPDAKESPQADWDCFAFRLLQSNGPGAARF